MAFLSFHWCSTRFVKRMPLKKNNCSTESVWEPQLLCTGERDALFSPDLGAPAIPSSLSATLGRLRTKARRPVNSLPHKAQVSLMPFGEQTAFGQKGVPSNCPSSHPFPLPRGAICNPAGRGESWVSPRRGGQLRPVSGDRLRTESAP